MDGWLFQSFGFGGAMGDLKTKRPKSCHSGQEILDYIVKLRSSDKGSFLAGWGGLGPAPRPCSFRMFGMTLECDDEISVVDTDAICAFEI
jgi:hypothetical protein